MNVKQATPCSEPDCDRPNRARKLCAYHYYWRKCNGVELPPLVNGTLTLADRYRARVVPADGCWGWTGSTDRQGYGYIRHGDRNHKAHRVSWELANGRPIPDGLMILHSCDNPPCTNPDHLRPGTAKDNSADFHARNKSAPRNRTHCINGHEYTPENTGTHKGGWRVCLTCKREYSRNYVRP